MHDALHLRAHCILLQLQIPAVQASTLAGRPPSLKLYTFGLAWKPVQRVAWLSTKPDKIRHSNAISSTFIAKFRQNATVSFFPVFPTVYTWCRKAKSSLRMYCKYYRWHKTNHFLDNGSSCEVLWKLPLLSMYSRIQQSALHKDVIWKDHIIA